MAVLSKESKCWRPSQTIARQGRTVNTQKAFEWKWKRAKSRKGRRCMDQIACVMSPQVRSQMSDRSALCAKSFLKFLRQLLFPGGHRQLRSGWDSLNDCGIVVRWRSGVGPANNPILLSEDFRGDVSRRRRGYRGAAFEA